MKCVILAGGKGARLSELTHKVPKPMIKICGKPIIIHIILHYAKYGQYDFLIRSNFQMEIHLSPFKSVI